MNEDRLNELLKQCESPIERKLLRNLYPQLTEDCAHKLHAQYKIDFYPDMDVTIPDFAFPDMKIAIYCDGFAPRKGNWNIFRKDRLQLRELQLWGWIVLRFAGSEIHRNSEMVIKTIQRTIEQREWRRINYEELSQLPQTVLIEKVLTARQMWKRREEEFKAVKKALDALKRVWNAPTEWIAYMLRSIRPWQYTTVLGVGLLIAIVLLWFEYSKPEVPKVRMIGEVAWIPAGEFRMGSDAEVDEHPTHTVHVDDFYIDKYEVTNFQYKKFVDANPQWQKNSIQRVFHNGKYLNLWQDNTYPPGKEDHPVVYVSWYAAMAYAQWAEKRLPTEAEWEKAARGKLVGAKYPWGDKIDSTMANYGGEVGDTKPVGSYPPNDYGLYDMAGNVMEWCLDAYDEGFYSRSPPRNPIAGGTLVNIVANFQTVTSLRVARDGSWYTIPMHVRVADRYGTPPDNASRGRGFRCAKNIR